MRTEGLNLALFFPWTSLIAFPCLCEVTEELLGLERRAVRTC